MGTKSSSLFEFALLSRHIQPKHFGCFFFSFNFFSFRLSRCVFSFYSFIYLLCRFAFAFRCCRRRHHRRRRRRHFCCSSNCYSAILSLFLLLFGGLSRAICILFLFSHFKSFVLTYSSFFSVVFFFFLPLFSFQCSAFLHFSIVVDVCVCVWMCGFKIFTVFSIYGNSWCDISTLIRARQFSKITFDWELLKCFQIGDALIASHFQSLFNVYAIAFKWFR